MIPYAEYERDEHLWKKLQHGVLKSYVLYPENENELKLLLSESVNIFAKLS